MRVFKIVLSFANSKDPNLSQIKTFSQKEPLRAIMKLFFSQYPLLTKEHVV